MVVVTIATNLKKSVPSIERALVHGKKGNIYAVPSFHSETYPPGQFRWTMVLGVPLLAKL